MCTLRLKVHFLRLLCLLDYPLVARDLSKNSQKKVVHQRNRELAEQIMVSLSRYMLSISKEHLMWSCFCRSR